MATQSLATGPDTQALQLIETNSAQLESSSNVHDQTRALILDFTYDAPAFANVEEFKFALAGAEKGADVAADNVVGNLVELIRYLAMVRSYRSERGVNAHLRQASGIPAGFERWYVEDFKPHHDIPWAYKTVLHKIAELEGGCQRCGRLAKNASDHKKSCILYRPLIELAEPAEKGGGKGGNGTGLDMKAATNAHYADRYMAMIGLLTNAPADTKPEEIFATMRAEKRNTPMKI